MSQPIMLGDCVLGVIVEGRGLLPDMLIEVADFRYKILMPTHKRKVAGVKHVKLDQTYENCEGSFKTNATSAEAHDVIAQKVRAWFQSARQPNTSIFAREKYRESGGASRTVRFQTVYLTPGERTVSGEGPATQDWSWEAETFDPGV